MGFKQRRYLLGSRPVGKDVLHGCLCAGLLAFAGCAKMVTKPVKAAVDLTVKPVKIVTDAAVDIVEKPVRKAASVARDSVRPKTWFKKR